MSQSSGTSSLAGAFDKSLELGSDQLDNIQEDQDMPDAETRNDPPVIVEQSTSSSKRVREEPTSIEKSSSKKAKKDDIKSRTEDRESRLKKLIDELSTESPKTEVSVENPGGSPNSFLNLYNQIIKAEEYSKTSNQEVIRSYYNFGEQMTRRFEHYKLSYPKRIAEAKTNNEAIKQLSGVSETAFRKRKERALRIYDIFSCIGTDKIERVRSFTAMTISKLSPEDIDYIIVKCIS